VAATTERDRLATENSRLRRALAREGRLLFLGAVAILLIGGGIGTFVFFRHLAYGDLIAARQLLEQVQTDDETQRNQVSAQNVKITKLEIELTQTKADLEAVRPSKDRYNFAPNESRIAADGRLIIGLVGSPSNESVVLSINDKQQTMVAGQKIVVTPDPSTTCQVTVQSFTMVQAVVTATCAAAKPQ
jgi:hypothetical protein